MLPPQQVLRNLYGFFKNSGNFAIFTAIRRASSRVSSLGRRSPPRLLLEMDVGKLLTVVAAHDEALGQKRTSELISRMSALPTKADIETQSRDVRFVP